MTSPPDHLIERLKKLPAEIRLIIEKRIELYVLEFGESVSKNASKAIASLFSGLVFILSVIFALFALAFFVGDVLDNTAAGFAVVSALLLVTALVVYLLSPDLIETHFRDSIASAFLGKSKEDEQSKTSAKRLTENTESEATSDSYSEHTIKNNKPN